MKRVFGFTLAEILITLTMIGIMATMTIPAVLQNINDANLRVAWSKTYSDISSATTKIQSTQGDINTSSSNTLRDDYKKVLNFIKEDTVGNIFAPFYLYYKNTNNQGVDFSVRTDPAAILSNGVLVQFTINSPGCTNPMNNLQNTCGYIVFDVNGKKPPNMVGKDAMDAWLIKQNGSYRVIPIGSNGDDITCVAGSSDWSTTDGCSAASLKNGSMP